jgi:hypothetical protein
VIWFVAILWGSVYLLTHSFILSPVRILATTVATRRMRTSPKRRASAWLLTTVIAGMYCEACTGFWVGALIAYLGHWPLEVRFWAPAEAAVISAGLMALFADYGPRSVYEREQTIANGALDREMMNAGGFGTSRRRDPDHDATDLCGCASCVQERAEREYRESNLQ